MAFAMAILMLPLASAVSAYMPDHVAINYPYYFNADFGTTFKNSPCVLSAYDRFGTNMKSWNIDQSQNYLKTDDKGNIVTYVQPGNEFVTDEHYVFNLTCGQSSVAKNVTIEQPGSSNEVIWFLNGINYSIGRPQDFVLLAIGALGALLLAGIVYNRVFKRQAWKDN